MLAASAAFPVGANAQAAPPIRESAPLSAAMAEARRCPFYAMTNVDGLAIVEIASVSGPHVGDRLDPDSAKGPSFRRVSGQRSEPPTCLNSRLSALLWTMHRIYRGLRSASGSWLGDQRRLQGSWGPVHHGLLGSALGADLGYGLFRLGVAVWLDDGSAYWAIPTTHALLTTVISRG